MAIIFEVPLALSRYCVDKKTIELEGHTIGAVLAQLWLRYPRLESRVLTTDGDLFPYLLLARNGEPLPRKDWQRTRLEEGDRVELHALAEGG